MYRIPLLHIQDVLVSLPERLIGINAVLDIKIQENRENWGIEEGEKGYEVEYELENRWYPVYITNNKWVSREILTTVFTDC